MPCSAAARPDTNRELFGRAKWELLPSFLKLENGIADISPFPIVFSNIFPARNNQKTLGRELLGISLRRVDILMVARPQGIPRNVVVAVPVRTEGAEGQRLCQVNWLNRPPAGRLTAVVGSPVSVACITWKFPRPSVIR